MCLKLSAHCFLLGRHNGKGGPLPGASTDIWKRSYLLWESSGLNRNPKLPARKQKSGGLIQSHNSPDRSRQMRRYVLGLVLLMAAWLPPASSHPDSAVPVDVNARRYELNRLLAEEWEYEMRESPEFATVIGDYRYNDLWSDNSLAHVRQQRADLQGWLSRFDA